MPPYRHRIRIRYGEVDAQGVVFNAHYLAYIDDTLENWLEGLGPERDDLGWDMMLKKITLEWHGSVGSGDLLDIDCGVRRWGTSSWLVAYRGSHDHKAVFEAEVLYVSVRLGENTSFETPAPIREFLSRFEPPESAS